MGATETILDAIIDTLDAEGIVEQVQGASSAAEGTELKEGMNTLPAMQVYLQTIEGDAATPVQQTTFGGSVQQDEFVYHIDLYTVQRRNIGEDMRALLPQIEALRTLLRAQQQPPFFGTTAIKQFHWTMERVTFDYASQPYVGARVVLTVRHWYSA